jgi:hypothetical protein
MRGCRHHLQDGKFIGNVCVFVYVWSKSFSNSQQFQQLTVPRTVFGTVGKNYAAGRWLCSASWDAYLKSRRCDFLLTVMVCPSLCARKFHWVAFTDLLCVCVCVFTLTLTLVLFQQPQSCCLCVCGLLNKLAVATHRRWRTVSEVINMYMLLIVTMTDDTVSELINMYMLLTVTATGTM